MFDLTIEFGRSDRLDGLDGLAAFGEALGQAGIRYSGHDHRLIPLTNDQVAAAAATKAWDRDPSGR